MCGITGVFNVDGAPVAISTLRRMTDALQHRGPDGEGFWTQSYVGEIYNFQELRVELESLGHTFRSRSDTEVALRAWLEWGPACVRRFNGMFALAVWDER